ncbi:D-amino-acid transaminase [Candidatus Viadribacter manganicus]|uniref:Probable branched-chain-amino-acid aminotransferase n=1 Tax=Candidatus Viadribacter manganicus TaxID=1759059 RepID=A0A1B1AD65_9PROT|nr:D-amino-acid transaminase [Candidatus Viadribacter manganicus]ANP44498.1 D-amino acid aminotransferase [Candidatus Viadribacter manganicus]
MSRVAYVNGAYVPLRGAGVSIMDRGFQFADSIYEVWAIRGGRLFDVDEHMARLQRSLAELRITPPMGEASLMAVIRETIRRNRVHDGIVYVQVSRGAANRDHVFPPPRTPPTLIVTAKNLDQRAIAARASAGIKVTSTAETRWARRDIKTVNLLPNVLARQGAKEQGAFEAWFVDGGGHVTEGASSNAWIVDASGVLRTRALSKDILHGVTRGAILRLAQERQMKIEERPFTLAEAKEAREAFITAASNAATAVVEIDGVRIGDGKPGPVTEALRAAYLGA